MATVDNSTQLITSTESGTGWSVDVTNANLDPDLTLKDFIVKFDGAVQNNADFTKTSQTIITYNGVAIGSTTVTIQRDTPNERVKCLTFGDRLQSAEYEAEFNRVHKLINDSEVGISVATDVKVTVDDTTPGTLEAKTDAGADIALTVLNPGANEQLRVSYTGDAVGDPHVDINSTGTSASALGTDAIAIGEDAIASGNGSVQIGIGTNAVASTMQFLTQTIVNSDGIQAPTFLGVPTSIPADGSLAVDTSNNEFYFRSNGSWELLSPPGDILITDTTYYVDVINGNDANSGTAPGIGNAWQTIGRALDFIEKLDCNNFGVSISIAAGDYTAEGWLHLPPIRNPKTETCGGGVALDTHLNIIGSGSVTVRGFEADQYGYYGIETLRFFHNNSEIDSFNRVIANVHARRGSVVWVKNCTFYATSVAASAVHLEAEDNAFIGLDDAITFDGSVSGGPIGLCFSARRTGTIRVVSLTFSTTYTGPANIFQSAFVEGNSSEIVIEGNLSGSPTIVNNSFIRDGARLLIPTGLAGSLNRDEFSQVNNIDYDNTTSGLTANTKQAAIDEIVTLLVGSLVNQDITSGVDITVTPGVSNDRLFITPTANINLILLTAGAVNTTHFTFVNLDPGTFNIDVKIDLVGNPTILTLGGGLTNVSVGYTGTDYRFYG